MKSGILWLKGPLSTPDRCFKNYDLGGYGWLNRLAFICKWILSSFLDGRLSGYELGSRNSEWAAAYIVDEDMMQVAC